MRSLILLMLSAVVAPLWASPAADDAQTRTIVLVRHGQYADDPAADPVLGPSLTELGVAQARLLQARLSGMPAFDRVLVSPMTRAQETARVLVSDLPSAPMETIADLAECTPPTRRTQVTATMKAEDLESCAKQLDRLFDAEFRPAVGQPDRLMLVCHGNVTRYLITKALGVDSKAWLEMSLGHTSLSTIRIEADGQYRLIAAGDVGHLPPNFQTGTNADPERSLELSKD